MTRRAPQRPHARPAARGHASSAATPATPKARCWSPSATPACCAPPASKHACPRFLRGKGEGWVTAEYGMLPRATHTRMRPRSRARQAGRAHAGDPAPDRPRAARLRRPHARSANAPSRSTATCCRPTAARAPPRSPAPTSRWSMRCAVLQQRARDHARTRSSARSPRCRSASIAACRCSTSTTPRTATATPT